MRNKAFSPSLKKKHDAIGKSLAAEILRDTARAVHVTDNHKEDNADFSDGFWDQLYRLPNGNNIKVEPEMKDEKWWGNQFSKERPFKYDSMDIPYRKAKNEAHLHIVISTCGTFAFTVTRKAMDEALVKSGGVPKVKRTIYEHEGAPYFSTPVESGRFFQKGADGRWRAWKHPQVAKENLLAN